MLEDGKVKEIRISAKRAEPLSGETLKNVQKEFEAKTEKSE